MISTKTLTMELKAKKKKALKIKLYRTIEEACLQTGDSSWYDLAKIIALNPPGVISCYTYKDEDSVLSLKNSSKSETTQFANCKNIEIQIV